MERLIAAPKLNDAGTKLMIEGLVPSGKMMHRNEIYEGMYSSLPRDAEARVWIYTFEFLPKAYTNPHSHNGATFFLLLQGAFEAHFDDGTVMRAKTGDVYSEPIGKTHRGYNPSADVTCIGVSFNLTSPDREHIKNSVGMENDPVQLHGW